MTSSSCLWNASSSLSFPLLALCSSKGIRSSLFWMLLGSILNSLIVKSFLVFCLQVASRTESPTSLQGRERQRQRERREVRRKSRGSGEDACVSERSEVGAFVARKSVAFREANCYSERARQPSRRIISFSGSYTPCEVARWPRNILRSPSICESQRRRSSYDDAWGGEVGEERRTKKPNLYLCDILIFMRLAAYKDMKNKQLVSVDGFLIITHWSTLSSAWHKGKIVWKLLRRMFSLSLTHEQL